MQYVLVVGDPFVGFTIFGTFDTPEAAAKYAEGHKQFDEITWWIVSLVKPKED